MAKLLHVLGAGLWQVPTIRLARERGYDVLVTDVYEERPGYAFATKHEVADIRDREATLAIAKRENISGIICDTTDVGVTTAAFVAESLGLRGIGYETAQRFTNKHEMREHTSRAGVANPWFIRLRPHDALGRDDIPSWPLVVKPIDSQSSRGVSKVSEWPGFSAALQHARENSWSGDVLVEGWIDGIEVTVEAACYEGAVWTLGISDKEHYAHAPQVASRLAYPPAFDAEVRSAIERANERVIRALGLRTGVTHAEYIVTERREVVLVEIAARGGGSRVYSRIAPYLAGIDVPAAYIDWTLGSEEPWPSPAAGDRAAVLQFLTAPEGVVKAIHGLEEARMLPGVDEVEVELRIGAYFAGARDDRSRPGFTIVLGETRAQVLAVAEQVRDTVRVEVR